MKAFSLLAVGALFGMSAVALAESPWGGFSDYNDFEDWYSEAAVNMWEEGVITGYEDGSFGAGNTVNRAELAVILDRYTEQVVESKIEIYTSTMEAYFDAEIMDVLQAEEQMSSFTFDSEAVKAAVIMAEAGLKMQDDAPGSEGQYTEQTDVLLPEGYHLYVDETVRNYGASSFFLYFDGEQLIGGDAIGAVQQWYGPFSYLEPDNL